MKTAKLTVYLKGGIKHSYDIQAETEELLGAKAREHVHAIASAGFRANSGHGDFEHFMPHWIDKIKVEGANVQSDYATHPKGT